VEHCAEVFTDTEPLAPKILSNTNLLSQAAGSFCPEKPFRRMARNIDKQFQNLDLIPLSLSEAAAE
jgi:hypothetical protein